MNLVAVTPIFHSARLAGWKSGETELTRFRGPMREIRVLGNLSLKAAALSTILASLLSGAEMPSSAAAALPSLEAVKQFERGISGHKLHGALFFTCGVDQLKTFTGQLTALEAEAARTKGASWTLGQKRLLFIRVDFADLPGTPFSDATGAALISNLNAFYTDMSYGRASFALPGAGSEVTPTLRLPQAAA